MSATEVIDQIKHLSPAERAQVAQFVLENEAIVTPGNASAAMADDGLAVIRANGGALITSRLVHELDSMTP